MVFGTLKDCERYYSLNERFEKGFDFIKKAIKENLADGKYEIDGKELYASVQSYDTKPAEERKFEGHKNYIDIQYISSGIEEMDVFDISGAESNVPYNAEKDVELYRCPEVYTICAVGEGEYGIFFPEDIHRPGVAYNNLSKAIKKIVVKVKI